MAPSQPHGESQDEETQGQGHQTAYRGAPLAGFTILIRLAQEPFDY
jgi:hypothetical protein